MYRRWVFFAVTSSMFLTSQFYRASNAVIAPYLINDLSLHTKGLGLLSAAFFYSFALTQIPVGILLDRIGARLSMTALSLVAVGGTFIFAWSSSLPSGVLGRALMGIGMGCNLMGTLKIVTIWFSPNTFATLSGIIFSIGTLGNMLATTPLALLVEHVGWRMALSMIAAFNFFQIMVLYVVVRDRPASSASTFTMSSAMAFKDIFSGLQLLFRQKEYWIISCAAFFRYGVFATVQALWAGPYLINGMGLTTVMAGNLLLVLNIAMILGGPFWGGLSDRVFKRRKTIMILSLGMMTVSTVCLALVPKSAWIALMFFFFFCFGFSAGNANILFTHIKECMPIQLAGVSMTGINFFTMMGAAVFIHGIGTLMQHLYPNDSMSLDAFRSAFLVCALFLLIGVVLYFFAKDTTSKKETAAGVI